MTARRSRTSAKEPPKPETAHQRSVADWLDTAKPRVQVQCRVCRDEAAKAAVAEFAAVRAARDTSITWRQFREDYLMPVLGWTGSLDSLHKHVRNHLET